MKDLLSAALLGSLLVPSLCAQELSVYVPMQDGTRLAVDVYLPQGATLEDPLPVLFELTRYWRSAEDPRTGRQQNALRPLDRGFLDSGYALAKVDVRGTGASFGTRHAEYGTQEVRDAFDLMEWTVSQPWCDGNLGAFGTSYSGTTAELMCAVKHPALKAVIPGWSDFDLFISPARPYGLYAKGLIEVWGDLVGQLDANQSGPMGGSVRRTSGDLDGALLRAAVAQHAGNLDVAAAVSVGEFRDQPLMPGADSYLETSPLHWKEHIEASKTPMLVLASWFDAGTVMGAMERWRRFSNPQKLVLMAGNHGGGSHGSPYTVSGRPLAPVPSQEDQFQLRLEFFDHHLRGEANGVQDWPPIQYFNLGEEAFRESDQWPPAGTRMERLYCAEEFSLGSDAPRGAGSDSYQVDFGVSTGAFNRWETQMGKPVLQLDRREAMDERMLCFTGDPLEEDLQLNGSAIVTLRLVSDREDGAFLAYLEDVAPDGQSRYLTEGGLRALQRKESPDPLGSSERGQELPYHSFAKADAMPIVPGEEFELRFAMHPLSVRVPKGHRLRLALAGADAGTLGRLPAQGEHNFVLSRSALRPSFIELPVQR